jgi:hypothetical protein
MEHIHLAGIVASRIEKLFALSEGAPSKTEIRVVVFFCHFILVKRPARTSTYQRLDHGLRGLGVSAIRRVSGCRPDIFALKVLKSIGR